MTVVQTKTSLWSIRLRARAAWRGIIAHGIADDEVSIDSEHAAASPRRRSLFPYRDDLAGPCAAVPCFYDAVEEDGLDDLIGQLIVRWPEPLARNICRRAMRD
jgi:hypothetical protein